MVTITRSGHAAPDNNPPRKKSKTCLERAIKIDPEYREKLKSEKHIEEAEHAVTDSPLFDSIARVRSVFDCLLQLPPTREVLRWCAHKQTFLSELFEPVKKDLKDASLTSNRSDWIKPPCGRRNLDEGNKTATPRLGWPCLGSVPSQADQITRTNGPQDH